MYDLQDVVTIFPNEKAAAENVDTVLKGVSISRPLLTNNSPLLATLLPELTDKSERAIIVRGSEVAWVAIKIWMQCRSLLARPEDNNPVSAPRYLTVSQYVDIYEVAEHYRMRHVKNAAIDMLHEMVRSEWEQHDQELAGCIPRIFAELAQGSKLGKSCVHYFSNKLSEAQFSAMTTEHLHVGFLREYVKVMWQRPLRWEPTTQSYVWGARNSAFWHEKEGVDVGPQASGAS